MGETFFKKNRSYNMYRVWGFLKCYGPDMFNMCYYTKIHITISLYDILPSRCYRCVMLHFEVGFLLPNDTVLYSLCAFDKYTCAYLNTQIINNVGISPITFMNEVLIVKQFINDSV
jgi:hypothetical protein